MSLYNVVFAWETVRVVVTVPQPFSSSDWGVGLEEQVQRALGVQRTNSGSSDLGCDVVYTPPMSHCHMTVHAGLPFDVLICLLGPVNDTPMAYDCVKTSNERITPQWWLRGQNHQRVVSGDRKFSPTWKILKLLHLVGSGVPRAQILNGSSSYLSAMVVFWACVLQSIRNATIDAKNKMNILNLEPKTLLQISLYKEGRKVKILKFIKITKNIKHASWGTRTGHACYVYMRWCVLENFYVCISSLSRKNLLCVKLCVSHFIAWIGQ